MKKFAYMIMTFSFILIISGGVSSFLVGLRKDREGIQRRVVEVNDIFEVFSANTSVFESERDSLYEEVLKNLYFDTMYSKDKEVKDRISNYEHLVDELSKNTRELDHLCKNVYYPDSTTNKKCRNYLLIYEQVVNYFVTDILEYNNSIDKYNKYQEEMETLLRLKRYETDKTYIDYNHDNVFDGREE